MFKKRAKRAPVAGYPTVARPHAGFVGRHEELTRLADHYRRGAETGLLYGPAAIGKTSLAQAFARTTARELFPDGVSHLNASPYLRAELTTQRESVRWSPKHLLVLDDIEFFPEPELRDVVQLELRALGQSPLLLVGRSRPADVADFEIQLGALSEAAVAALASFELPSSSSELVSALTREFGGHPLPILMTLNWLRTHGDSDISAFLDLVRPFAQHGLIGTDGKPLGAGDEQQIVATVQEVDDALIDRLAQDPSQLFTLSSRQFELVVAEILERLGYSVSVTQATRDGGKDMYAASRTSLGSFLYVVECKLYSPENPVSVRVVRDLYGVVEAERANAGLVISTSSFTQPATAFTETVRHRISLKDYANLREWLTSVSAKH